ncbi:type 1 glutamine amidotransferase domain-containing protein [Bradyrhizobium sp. Arg68]|uniref:type 1 glutamine amidotransferase domain-containing protein n=1 Tax=Bradyrhizobium ivorense TaxID=2511166 RepID=UPI001E31F08E|nr:type 1 glutamine amidotransferase domain-containing protein [Bradyrhizobium ivorense]MCC8935667.1 type 1 glutamine amidotransferase domain-containing protein [Bradyrhizobium ivorense]
MHALIVLTSHDRLGDSGRKTGVCLESFAHGYYACVDAGFEVTICSPLGGQAPIDKLCNCGNASLDIVKRFHADRTAREDFSDALTLSQVCAADFAAVYFPEGCGALWDLADDPTAQSLILRLQELRCPCAFVGHGTAALLRIRGPDSVPLVKGRGITAPNRGEDAAYGMPADAVSLERELASLGASYIAGPDGVPHLVQDGRWITGQNSASSAIAARALVLAAM